MDIFQFLKTKTLEKFPNSISEWKDDPEGLEYSAGSFNLNGVKSYFRIAKTTPIKKGFFVTFWKRDLISGKTCPFKTIDEFGFLVIAVSNMDKFGWFVFPKSVLEENKILSTSKGIGKMAFRLYPPWEEGLNKQALGSQKWQSKYFHE